MTRRRRARTLPALTPASLRTSEPQSLKTDHPVRLNSRSTRRSRLRFRTNLAIQKSVFVAGAAPFLNHVRPCQKSPSTNTASLARRNEKSGLPKILVSFLRKRRPIALSAPARRSSGSVSAVRTARMMRARVCLSNMSATLQPVLTRFHTEIQLS